MPLLVQVCVVIATAAAVTVAFVMIRVLRRLEKAAEGWSRVSSAWSRTAVEVESVMRDTRDLTASLRGAVIPLQNAARHLEAVAGRATSLSQDVLDEVVTPVRGLVGVIAGVKAGTRTLVDSWKRRTHGAQNGG